MTVHEEYRRRINPVLYDPADDGPEIEITECVEFLEYRDMVARLRERIKT